MTGLQPIRGHDEVRSALAAAVLRNGLANALLFTGPAGVGKQRLALWLGQMLLCTAPGPSGPCGTCRDCRFSLRLEHPDLLWFFPLPRPKVSGGSERLGEALEEARAIELESRRAEPWYPTLPNELVGIYLAHAQVIRRMAASRPAMARHKVFIIGNADLLVPQEASPEAANALLKLLEEPPRDTTIIATTAEPDGLLPTVRSRLLPVRVAPLAAAEVAAVIEEVRNVSSERALLAARLAGGSIGRALGFISADGDAGPLEETRLAARDILDAVARADGAAMFTLALGQAPAGARGDFSTLLESMMTWLRDLAAVDAGAEDLIVNVDALDWLRSVAGTLEDVQAGAAAALADLNEALQLAQFNINPQMALSHVLRTMASRFRPARAGLASAGSRA